MRRHLLLALSLATATTTYACGDDATANCGAGTVSVNGQCVPQTTTTPTDTSVSTDTGTATTTTTPTDTSVTTTPPADTSVTPDTAVGPDTSGECTADEAGKGFVGAPCTKDCQCQQSVKGKPLTCYAGPYMDGFSFCTRKVDGTLSEGDGVESLTYVTACFEPAGIKRADFDAVYVKGCASLDDCLAISTAYTHCGTTKADFDWSTSDGVTDCPYWSTQGYCGGSSMVLKKTCIIDSAPPFDQSYVTGHESCQ